MFAISEEVALLRDPKGSALEGTCPNVTVSPSDTSDTSLSLFLSLKALTLTGATVEETVALVIGAMGLVEEDDFDVAGVESDGALEDHCD